MTDIYLAGAENTSHQQILASCGASKVSVNVTSLLRRRTSSWTLDLPYADWEWVAYCDSPATEGDLQEVLDNVSKPPVWVIGPESWSKWDNYLPLWNGEGAIPIHVDTGLMVTDRVFKSKDLKRRALSSRHNGNVLGAITGSTDPSIGKFDVVISGAWWSSMKFGETQVWDGQKLHRYNAERQGEVRERHTDDMKRLGIDSDLVMMRDPDETARLAVVSWQFYDQKLSSATIISFPKKSIVSNPGESNMDLVGSDPQTLDIPTTKGRHQTVIPVVGMASITSTERLGDGSEILEEQAIIRTLPESIRSCDNCFLASSGCPGFQLGASCAYSIPVEIRSKDQLQAVMQAMVELQTQRVLQARFAEEIAGQELSTEVGREMDRLFTSVEKMRDIMDNRESVKMTVEARGRSGVLSRLFGDRVGTNARMLAQPVDSEDVLDAILDEE
jgi:hypothetical protein